MTPAREEFLTQQYVWSIQNTGEWYRPVRAFADDSAFGPFRRLTGTFVSKIRNELNERLLDAEDWAFIYLALWTGLCGDPDAVRRDPGPNERSIVRALDRAIEARWPGDLAEEIQEHVSKAAELLDAVDQKFNQTKLENTMKDVAFCTKHFVFGQEVSTLTDEQLISSIKQIEGAINDLGGVKTTSKKIAAKIAELNDMLASVVATLDARA